MYLRALAVWLLLMLAETIHGTARIFLLAPLLGDLRAKQAAVFTGAAIIFLITYLLIKWISPARISQLFIIGSVWVLLTVSFEMALGIYVFKMPLQQIAMEYNLLQGGLMPIGLLLMFLSPYVAFMLKKR